MHERLRRDHRGFTLIELVAALGAVSGAAWAAVQALT